MAGRGSKDKGQRGHGGAHSGMGRLRRANAKQQTRIGNLERFVDDEDYLAQHEGTQRTAHTGASLLAKFNRLAEQFSAPQLESATIAEVCGFHSIFVQVRSGDGAEFSCQMRRRLKKMLKGEKSPLAVGDQVCVSMTAEGDRVIESILPRRNQLERRDSHNVSLSHVFAANVDCLVIVSALRDPAIKTGLIDRYLLIAHRAEVPAAIVLNKCDLEDGGPHAACYRNLGYDVFLTTAHDGGGDIPALRAFLAGKACVFAGHSGVGKSSLINACYPHFSARVGDVSQILHKGRHTTTSACSYLLDADTRLIDTPGIRELGVHIDSALDAALHFRDIAAVHPLCHFPNCTHTHEPSCAVKDAVRGGRIAQSRFASYLALLANDLGMDVGNVRSEFGIHAEENPEDEAPPM